MSPELARKVVASSKEAGGTRQICDNSSLQITVSVKAAANTQAKPLVPNKHRCGRAAGMPFVLDRMSQRLPSRRDGSAARFDKTRRELLQLVSVDQRKKHKRRVDGNGYRGAKFRNALAGDW